LSQAGRAAVSLRAEAPPAPGVRPVCHTHSKRDATKTQPWIWRCHIDLTHLHRDLWHYLRGFTDRFDAVIVSAPKYSQDVAPPQFIKMPATDPFSLNNREMSEEEIEQYLGRYKIPTDLPIVLQVSQFDIWKDPRARSRRTRSPARKWTAG